MSKKKQEKSDKNCKEPLVVQSDKSTLDKSTLDKSTLDKPKLDKKQYQELLAFETSKRHPSCGLIVIDNFYKNAMDTRNYILSQPFNISGNYPGKRTVSYATEHLKEIIQRYIEPFGGKITMFLIPNETDKEPTKIYNGAFQYTTSRDRSWVHTDKFNNWAGVLYMTPNAPITAGTSFYKFYDGTTNEADVKIMDNLKELDENSQDMTKWTKIDEIGNVFNRLILFDSTKYHMSMDYFGLSKEDSRLIQVFFFSTEK
jgi:hypothetical protein